MNSLVVLFSVLALTAAKPSGTLLEAPLVASYAAPTLYAAPAAVSHQSRIDIKSSPAYVATAAVAPVAYSAPAVYAAPAIYAAPAAVSHQSRIDIKSSPAIVETAIAAAPVAYSAPLIKSYAAPAFATAAIAAPVWAAPAAIASPGWAAPAAIAGPAVPLDTPEVIAARAAHFEAKALASGHLIHKRSAPFVASPYYSTYSSPLTYSHSYAYSAPLHTISYSAPIYPKAYGVHSW